jgi:hypothetical protein
MLPVYILSITLFAEFALDIPFDVPFANIGPLIKQLFTLTDTKLNLDDPVFKVYLERDERKPLFLELSGKPLDLVFMEQELLGTVGVMVKY